MGTDGNNLESMPPGTRFSAAVNQYGTQTLMLTFSGTVVSATGMRFRLEDIDPSTIRDVTPLHD